jgi:hypothetical protein
MTRTLSGLSPVDDDGRRALQRITHGQSVQVDIHRPRNNKNLRRWWALCKMVADNCEQFRSPDQVHDYLKIRSGHCTQIVSKTTGEVFLIADSISFSRLDEDEFQDVWLRAIKVVAEEILPGVSIPEIEAEILQLIGWSRGNI